MSNDMTISKYLDPKELAAFFRELADAVENGGHDEFACVDDFRKIKIGVKNEYGQISLKAKFKAAKPCTEEVVGEDGQPKKPKYKALKKRMRSSFKILLKMIHDGSVPPQEAVDAFLADSALMVTYPGYGDEYYESYTAACAEFKAAYESGDLERMHAAVDALVHEKGRCHAKYD
ncbi:GAK system XXXCH domain-containing protein [Pseudodesulfovibrio thermohalotolerans]|uniref:GAK system XXXCH domain-containing protein n=1 Tax=Pseudodesulfovibrio thermohalotolerans TaxID=2880651 RepID=UPI0024411C83|nr:GAK system XXXCH domain-containing protein [Pseudodesulfovibrio thermohalotolerans]WFS63181.1 GAK system XXXCH domain-containing protein [Pseudodesulfovibrio thermohalotolerans]